MLGRSDWIARKQSVVFGMGCNSPALECVSSKPPVAQEQSFGFGASSAGPDQDQSLGSALDSSRWSNRLFGSGHSQTIGF